MVPAGQVQYSPKIQGRVNFTATGSVNNVSQLNTAELEWIVALYFFLIVQDGWHITRC